MFFSYIFCREDGQGGLNDDTRSALVGIRNDHIYFSKRFYGISSNACREKIGAPIY